MRAYVCNGVRVCCARALSLSHKHTHTYTHRLEEHEGLLRETNVTVIPETIASGRTHSASKVVCERQRATGGPARFTHPPTHTHTHTQLTTLKHSHNRERQRDRDNIDVCGCVYVCVCVCGYTMQERKQSGRV